MGSERAEMSTDLDREIIKAWARFEADLVTRLVDQGDGEFLVLNVEVSDDDDVGPYVQFLTEEDTIRFEVSSNAYLNGRHQLSVRDVKFLLGLGFQDIDPDEGADGNLFINASAAKAPGIARIAVQVLREVLDVPHPAFLIPSEPLVETPAAPSVEIDFVTPRSREHLRALIDDALQPTFAHRLEHDDDGDVPIRQGSALLVVQAMARVPVVVIGACLVRDVAQLDRAAFEVGVLNRDTSCIRHVLEGDRIMAYCDVFARPFVADHLRAMVELMCEHCDAVDGDLAARVGGHTAFEPQETADETVDAAEDARLTLEQLEADGPESIDPELAAAACGNDRAVVLQLLSECEGERVGWEQQVQEALLEGDAAGAERCAAEVEAAARRVGMLRAALRVVVEADAHPRDEGVERGSG